MMYKMAQKRPFLAQGSENKRALILILILEMIF